MRLSFECARLILSSLSLPPPPTSCIAALALREVDEAAVPAVPSAVLPGASAVAANTAPAPPAAAVPGEPPSDSKQGTDLASTSPAAHLS